MAIYILTKLIKRKLYPISNIQDMLLKLEGFWFATFLDLNMGYCQVQINQNLRWIFMIVLPWGKYEYCWLSMGVSVALHIFQEKINDLFHGF